MQERESERKKVRAMEIKSTVERWWRDGISGFQACKEANQKERKQRLEGEG